MIAMINIRRATMADARELLEWRNDKGSRRASIGQDEIALDDHLAWLERVLADENRVLYIALEDGLPVGMSRFDLKDGEAEVSINLNPAFRGRGLSSEVLHISVDRFVTDLGEVPLTAQIRTSNSASIAIFTRARFVLERTEDDVGHYRRA